MASFPNLLNYSGVQPRAFPTKMRINRWLPQGNISQFAVTDVIRFIINTDGYLDPYSTYFQIEVDFIDMKDGNVLQLDGSAHGLIRTLVVKSGSQELERIEEYDTLANILLDAHYSIEGRSMLNNLGVGYNTDGRRMQHTGEIVNRQFATFGGLDGNIGKSCKQRMQQPHVTVEFDMEDTIANLQNHSNQNYGPVLKQTSTWPVGQGAFDPRRQILGIRETESSVDLTSTEFTDGPQVFENGEFGFSTVKNGDDQILHGNGRVDAQLLEQDFSKSPGMTSQDGTTEIPWSYSFTGTCLEDRFSTSINQNVIIDGVVAKQKITKAVFCIPVISGLLGILMPVKSHKLLPMALLKDLIIELQLNRFAFFSSGYPDATLPTDDLDIAYRRDTWSVTKVELVGEIIELDKQTDQALMGSLNNGIVLHSNSWMKGPTFSYASGEGPNGTLQVNQGFQSLRSIVISLHPLDYTIYPFCRKQFRISQNINYFQIKVGLQYYPSLAIQGNGGSNVVNPTNPALLCNSEFLINFQKAFGKYVDVLGDSFVNGPNFAVNDRVYDPANKTPWKNMAGEIKNYDTANGYPSYHENRCVGKALYCMDLESLSYDPNAISGLNTTKKIPYEIILKSDSQNAFKRKSELHIFQLYDCIIRFSNGGVEVLGRV